MFQVYVKGSVEAVALYQKAFGAKVSNEYKNEDGSYMHVELDVFGQVLAVSEGLPYAGESITGNTMQFCLHMGEGKEDAIKRAYEVLKDGAQIHSPLDKCFFSPLMFGLIDKFGVNWCMFI
jgi:PhnB protein